MKRWRASFGNGKTDSLERLLRRKQNMLVNSGGGVILLGLWSIIKGLLTVYLQFDDIVEPQMLTELGENAVFLKPIMIVMSFIGLGFVLLLRLFVGLNAYREGRGRRFRRTYPFFAIILFLLGLIGFILELRVLFSSDSAKDTTLATLLLDLASLFILFQTLAAVFSVRRLQKAKGEQ